MIPQFIHVRYFHLNPLLLKQKFESKSIRVKFTDPAPANHYGIPHDLPDWIYKDPNIINTKTKRQQSKENERQGLVRNWNNLLDAMDPYDRDSIPKPWISSRPLDKNILFFSKVKRSWSWMNPSSEKAPSDPSAQTLHSEFSERSSILDLETTPNHQINASKEPRPLVPTLKQWQDDKVSIESKVENTFQEWVGTDSLPSPFHIPRYS